MNCNLAGWNIILEYYTVPSQAELHGCRSIFEKQGMHLDIFVSRSNKKCMCPDQAAQFGRSQVRNAEC